MLGVPNAYEEVGGEFLMVTDLKITINDIPPSNNKYIGNSHNFNEYRKEKERWHWLIKLAISRGIHKPNKPFERAVVKITYYFKDKIRRDPDNYSGKMLLDPLVREGILIDDSFSVITLVLDGKVDKDNPRTEIEVRSEDI
jgi:Holliday junction resolvase RusA-like endonuclease